MSDEKFNTPYVPPIIDTVSNILTLASHVVTTGEPATFAQVCATDVHHSTLGYTHLSCVRDVYERECEADSSHGGTKTGYRDLSETWCSMRYSDRVTTQLGRLHMLVSSLMRDHLLVESNRHFRFNVRLALVATNDAIQTLTTSDTILTARALLERHFHAVLYDWSNHPEVEQFLNVFDNHVINMPSNATQLMRLQSFHQLLSPNY